METLCGILQMDWEIHALQKQCLNKLLSDRGIHFGQPPLLFTLRQLGRCSQKDLAKSLCVSPASIAVSLKRMEKAGLIMRVRRGFGEPNHIYLLIPRKEVDL